MKEVLDGNADVAKANANSMAKNGELSGNLHKFFECSTNIHFH